MARKTDPSRDLDAFDRSILRIVQRDNKTPQREIAASVNLSTAAVQRRIAAMEAAGIIARNVAMVDPLAIGLTITAIVEVYLRDERSMTVDAAKAGFRAAPEVQQCYYTTGGTSFVLVVVTKTMQTYEAFIRQRFEDNETVKSFRTLVVIDRVKTQTEIAIED
jgi:DNA-binding Lrp family transcriptional regulator